MLDRIVTALKAHKDLAGWSVRHIASQGAQLYLVGEQVEARRAVDEEKFKIEVLRRTKTAGGERAMGTGEVTVLPGGDIADAIAQAALVAGLVANPMHELPGPSALSQPELVDAEVKADSLAVLDSVITQMRTNAAKHKTVQLTSAECFAEVESIRFVNSRGIDAQQEDTEINVEFILQSRAESSNSETHREMTRRRVTDLDLEAEIALRAGYTRDLLDAGPPPAWQGPVVIRRDALATFIAGDYMSTTPLKTLGNAASKYAKISPWEIGKSIFHGEVLGDPLAVWANRRLAFGIASNRFDAEGLPAQRVEIIGDNKLVHFAASKRYADYLNIPATGDFGGTELPSGHTPAADLLAEPHVEICMFSWFNPEPISANFSSEIRLGYFVENGKAKPFKGGQLIGNVLDALANVRWSEETAFYGNYLGPHTARFNDLNIAGNKRI